MTLSQPQPESKRQQITEKVGPELAEIIMDLIPPDGWENLATKDDLRDLSANNDARAAKFEEAQTANDARTTSLEEAQIESNHRSAEHAQRMAKYDEMLARMEQDRAEDRRQRAADRKDWADLKEQLRRSDDLFRRNDERFAKNDQRLANIEERVGNLLSRFALASFGSMLLLAVSVWLAVWFGPVRGNSAAPAPAVEPPPVTIVETPLPPPGG